MNYITMITDKKNRSITFVRKTQMKYGYARVSRPNQNLDLQLDALRNYGVDYIFEEKISGVKKRPELEKLLSILKKGDILVIWKLDRLGRSLRDLVFIVDSLHKKEVDFRSLKDGINTNTPIGRCYFGIFASLAELEREFTIERTNAGLEAARERGRVGGRPCGLSKTALLKAKLAVIEYNKYLQLKDRTINDVCIIVGVSKATLYKYLKQIGRAHV